MDDFAVISQEHSGQQAPEVSSELKRKVGRVKGGVASWGEGGRFRGVEEMKDRKMLVQLRENKKIDVVEGSQRENYGEKQDSVAGGR